jgi:L-fuculose-phosphate aldolase
MGDQQEQSLRAKIVSVMQQMTERGMNRGTSGNASARLGDGLLITPTGVPTEQLTPEAIVRLDANGRADPGSLKPSSEWQMHLGIYVRRADAQAIVHCHSRYATILACSGRTIPSLHYMVGVSGKNTIPLAPYALFGSRALADAVITTLDGGLACLMANHGQITLGRDLDRASMIAEQVEEQAAVYWGTLAISEPTLLSPEQMSEVFEQFKAYRGYRQ